MRDITIQNITDWTLGTATDEARLAIEADLDQPDSLVREYIEWAGGEPNRPTPRLVQDDFNSMFPGIRAALEAISFDDDEAEDAAPLANEQPTSESGSPQGLPSRDHATILRLPQQRASSRDPTGQAEPPPTSPSHHLDPDKERMLQTAMKADIETLFASIGFFVDRARVALVPPDRQQLREAGKAWLADRKGDLKERLRQDPVTWALLSSAESDVLDVMETARRIVDLILPVCGEIPATHVAVLLVKRKLGD
jgi:hypothetical protein